MRNIGDNWEDFLIRNHFKEEEEEELSGKTKKSRRTFPIEDNSPPQQEKHSEDETPLPDMLGNIKKKNVRKNIANTKEESSSKNKTEQEKQSGERLKSIPLLLNHHLNHHLP